MPYGRRQGLRFKNRTIKRPSISNTNQEQHNMSTLMDVISQHDKEEEDKILERERLSLLRKQQIEDERNEPERLRNQQIEDERKRRIQEKDNRERELYNQRIKVFAGYDTLLKERKEATKMKSPEKDALFLKRSDKQDELEDIRYLYQRRKDLQSLIRDLKSLKNSGMYEQLSGRVQRSLENRDIHISLEERVIYPNDVLTPEQVARNIYDGLTIPVYKGTKYRYWIVNQYHDGVLTYYVKYQQKSTGVENKVEYNTYIQKINGEINFITETLSTKEESEVVDEINDLTMKIKEAEERQAYIDNYPDTVTLGGRHHNRKYKNTKKKVNRMNRKKNNKNNKSMRYRK